MLEFLKGIAEAAPLPRVNFLLSHARPGINLKMLQWERGSLRGLG